MRTSEACSRDVVAARRTTLLSDAARMMRESHVGSIVVLDGDPPKPVGIVTDRDIVVEVVAAELDPRTVTLGEVMGSDLVTANENDDALATLALMRRCGVRRVPVVDAAGQLTGIVALDDLLELAGGALGDIVTAINTERSLEAVRRR
ncbi:MAG TPA: CBS domain-containing protein [Myxococcota bacterium]|nr:CBS domain-containing protein [Myxococcota bacterium]